MRSLLERLLVLTTPLFAAATSGKKSTHTKTKRPGTARPTTKTTGSKGTRKTPVRATPKPALKPKGRAGKAERPVPARKAPEQPAAKTTPPQAKAAEPKPVAPVGRAILLAPQNGNYAYSVPEFRFRWLSVGGANRYEVAWSEHPDFSGAQVVSSVATESAVPEKSLRVGAVYYWRVRVGNAGGWGPWSDPNSFQVLETPPPS